MAEAKTTQAPTPTWFRVLVGNKKPWCRRIEEKNGEFFKNKDGSIICVPAGYYVLRSNAGKSPHYSLCSPELFNRDVLVLEEH